MTTFKKYDQKHSLQYSLRGFVLNYNKWILTIFFIFLSGCSAFESLSPLQTTNSSSSPPPSPPPPSPPTTPSPPDEVSTENHTPTENFSDFISIGPTPHCLETNLKRANACIFKKNPVADNGSALSIPPVLNTGAVLSKTDTELRPLTDMSYIQTHAVYLPGENLVNDNFIISDLNGDHSTVSKNTSGNWKYSFANDSNFSLIQIHIFFWLNYLTDLTTHTMGSSYNHGQKIRVIPVIPFEEHSDGSVSYHKNAFWTGPYQNSMIFGVSQQLGQDQSGHPIHAPLALDTSIAAHELGHAMLDYATNTALRSSETLEESCGSSRCSKSLEGSLGAIHEGVGDIVSLFLFPESPSIGELFYNSLSGLTHCGDVPRSVQQIKEQNLSAEDLFNACASREKEGEIHAFGSVYSVIWYGLFQRAFERGGHTEKNDAYALFFEHLKNMTKDDSFETARQIIKSIDKNLFDERFSEDLDSEYRLLGYEI